MEFGECIYDFDVIDVAERSPLHNQHLEGEEGNLKTSKSWCGPLNQLIVKSNNKENVVTTKIFNKKFSGNAKEASGTGAGHGGGKHHFRKLCRKKSRSWKSWFEGKDLTVSSSSNNDQYYALLPLDESERSSDLAEKQAWKPPHNGDHHQQGSNSGSGLSLADSGCSGSTSGGLARGLETKSAVARLAQAGALLTAASWASGSSWDRDVLCSALSSTTSGLQGCSTKPSSTSAAGQPSATLLQSSQGGECMKTSATIEDFRKNQDESKETFLNKGAKAVTLLKDSKEGQEDNNKVLGCKSSLPKNGVPALFSTGKMSSGDETKESSEAETTSEAEKEGSTKSIIVVSRGAKEGDPPLWTIVNSSAPCRAMNSTAVNVITGTRITHGHPLLLGSPPHTTSDMMDAPWLSDQDCPSTSTSEAKTVRQCSLPMDPLVTSSDSVGNLPCISATVQSASHQDRKNRLKRAMTLPVQSEAAEAGEEQPLLQLGPSFNYAPLRSPMRTSGKPLVPNSETSETLLDVPILVASTAASEAATTLPAFEIPTFTVTINPLESNEMTFVPGSPPSVNDSGSSGGLEQQPLLSEAAEAKRRIANTTVIVDDEDDEELRRCSIGSASSLQSDNRCTLGLPSTLGIRRISEISHINELRRGVSGMEHLTTEFYEISREPNPDCISLDSIHKRVLKRCQNKYIPPQRSTTTNKCFVVVTSGFTILGIIYTFWYKNFGPGSDSEH